MEEVFDYDTKVWGWAEMINMGKDSIPFLVENPDAFEELPGLKEKKKVYNYVKKLSPNPEDKDNFKWLTDFMKENMEGAADKIAEKGLANVTAATTGEELGKAAMEMAAQLATDEDSELTPELRELVEYLNGEIDAISRMVDRNNYQTARRMAFRQVKALILGIDE